MRSGVYAPKHEGSTSECFPRNIIGDFSADGGFEGDYQRVLVPQMKLLGQMIGGQLKNGRKVRGASSASTVPDTDRSPPGRVERSAMVGLHRHAKRSDAHRQPLPQQRSR